MDEKIFYKANAISIHKSWVALQLYWAGLARSTSNVTAVWLTFLVIFLKMFMKTATPNHQYRFMEQCEVFSLSFQCHYMTCRAAGICLIPNYPQHVGIFDRTPNVISCNVKSIKWSASTVVHRVHNSKICCRLTIHSSSPNPGISKYWASYQGVIGYWSYHAKISEYITVKAVRHYNRNCKQKMLLLSIHTTTFSPQPWQFFQQFYI